MKKNVLLAFNKITFAFLGVIEANHIELREEEHEYLIYKKVSMDLSKESWIGDYSTGSIVEKEKQIVEVFEETLNKKAMEKIRSQVDYYKQINILIAIIDYLIIGEPVPEKLIIEYKEAKSFIADIRMRNERYKQAYEQSETHTFVSLNEQDKMTNEQLEGGIHDVLVGAREVTKND